MVERRGVELLDRALDFVPALVAVLVIAGLHYLLYGRDGASAPRGRLRRQVAGVGLYLAGLVAIIVALPLSDEVRSQLLSLIGLIVSATITLSATSLVGNALAGLMLRALRNFHAGDFVHVGEHFGRVSDRGLFHVEIQTEDRDLVTLPNLYLATHPVRVVRNSGTIVSARVSLGYDVSWNHVEAILAQAAENAGLNEPFVQVLELGDYSVVYRAAGFLTDVRTLISARSRLRTAMLDGLHGANIEIVSPIFMNQRPLRNAQRFVPSAEATHPKTSEHLPEDVVFDKADEAQTREFLEREHESLGRRLDDLRAERGALADERLHAHLDYEIERTEQRRTRISEILEDVPATE